MKTLLCFVYYVFCEHLFIVFHLQALSLASRFLLFYLIHLCTSYVWSHMIFHHLTMYCSIGELHVQRAQIHSGSTYFFNFIFISRSVNLCKSFKCIIIVFFYHFKQIKIQNGLKIWKKIYTVYIIHMPTPFVHIIIHHITHTT